jgi:hypothetical protein
MMCLSMRLREYLTDFLAHMDLLGRDIWNAYLSRRDQIQVSPAKKMMSSFRICPLVE